MTQYIIVYKEPKTGGVTCLAPSPRWLRENGHNYSKLAEKRVPKNREWRLLNIKDLPKTREFRLSWRYSDLKECPDCYKKSLERLKYQLAVESQDSTRIALQRLENKLKGIENINNLQELKSIEMEMRNDN